jgi:hypothetical protein
MDILSKTSTTSTTTDVPQPAATAATTVTAGTAGVSDTTTATDKPKKKKGGSKRKESSKSSGGKSSSSGGSRPKKQKQTDEELKAVEAKLLKKGISKPATHRLFKWVKIGDLKLRLADNATNSIRAMIGVRTKHLVRTLVGQVKDSERKTAYMHDAREAVQKELPSVHTFDVPARAGRA